ncbi:MAG TPA: dynamin family protein [Burkholderiales bacterium]
MAFRMIGAQSATARAGAAVSVFGKRLADYRSWCDELAGVINEYQTWVEAQGLGTGEDDLRVYELIDDLRSDRLTVALVAEFSRGKTELINAIFFADYKQRLLPSDAGRTTMCPTELLYDPALPPCVRLLPIETRRSPLTIAEFKRDAAHWTTLPLDLERPKAMAATLLEIARTRPATAAEAEELGLCDPRAPQPLGAGGEIEIPVWRHAIINFPHPLLKQGLVVLDTPGLNSLGTEPELTISMLPAAHAVLFVLAADAGVTKSDLDVWNNHVCVAKHGSSDARLVVLNKVDALWDELRTPEMLAESLDRQIEDTARILGVSKRQVFPVSAQKGLLGKIKADQALVARSGLPALEQKLSNNIIGAKQELMRERITREIGAIVANTRALIEARLAAIERQLDELTALSGKSQQTIEQTIERMQRERREYDETLASFQSTRVLLSEQTRTLLEYLSVESFDALMAQTRKAMRESWTTHGLQLGMRTLFEGAVAAMEKAHAQAERMACLVAEAYEHFHREHGLAAIRPTPFSLVPFRSQLERLRSEAEAFRRSPIMVMTEQHFVIKKFFITLASRARLVFQECNAAARNWSKAIMTPILVQLREHKLLMDQRLDNLKRVRENLGNLGARIAELEATRANLENQLLIIENMLRKIDRPAAAKLDG